MTVAEEETKEKEEGPKMFNDWNNTWVPQGIYWFY